MKKPFFCSNPRCKKHFIARAGKGREEWNRYCSRLCFRTHDRDPRIAFWKYVNKLPENGCWLWVGSTAQGYGSFGYYKRDASGHSIMKINAKAHRFSYEIHVKPIPEGMQVLHKCDNPSCVNPAHLFLGTLHDNMKDRNNKRRHAFGERSGRAKLTSEQVASIRQLSKDGETQVRLAERFNVSRRNIRSIISGGSWASV